MLIIPTSIMMAYLVPVWKSHPGTLLYYLAHLFSISKTQFLTYSYKPTPSTPTPIDINFILLIVQPKSCEVIFDFTFYFTFLL